MIITYIHRIGWFIGLVLLQVLILNNVHIAGYATPFLYIYFILKFNSGQSRTFFQEYGNHSFSEIYYCKCFYT